MGTAVSDFRVSYAEFIKAVDALRKEEGLTWRGLGRLMGTNSTSTMCRFSQGKQVSGHLIHALHDWLVCSHCDWTAAKPEVKPYCCPVCNGHQVMGRGLSVDTDLTMGPCKPCGGTGILWR